LKPRPSEYEAGALTAPPRCSVSDVLSESDVKVSDFEPEIVRKIQKTVHHLSNNSESKSAKKQDNACPRTGI
jgi:hypothetical protein